MLRVFQAPFRHVAWRVDSGGLFRLRVCCVFCFELLLRGFANPLLTSLLWLGETSAAAIGLLLAGYTAVLIGATAIPVWSENRKLLPAHFLTSGLGGSAAILELAGFLIPATQILGFAASGIETVIEIFLEVRKRPVDAPLHHGRSGTTLRIAGLLEGPAALLLRVFWGSVPAGRYAAASCFLIGALLSAMRGSGRAALLPVTPTPCFTSSAKPKERNKLNGRSA